MGGDRDLDILFPDREVRVQDPDSGEPVTLTLHEFRFREGLEATALARPLIAALAALVPAREDGVGAAEAGEGAGPDALAVEAALAAHAALWLELAARACGRDAGWLARLGDADGRALCRAVRARGRVNPVFAESPRDVPALLDDVARHGDVVLTLGAGDVGGLPGMLRTRWATPGPGEGRAS